MYCKISLSEIIDLIYKLRDKIEKYSDLFRKNEMLVRYSLIDPFLRALGWDTEDPSQVEPEYNMEAGVPDYALKMNGKVTAFVEAKALGKKWDVLKLIAYATARGVPYVIATDGDLWEIYDVFKRVEMDKKLVASWRITKDEPAEIALKALSIANLASKEVFGKPAHKPLLMQMMQEEAEEGEAAGGPKRIKGPITSRLARILILQVLGEAGKPLKIKEIEEEISRRVELTDYDKEKTKSGDTRWRARVRWMIHDLYKNGLIERIEEGTYKITSKGLDELREIAKEVKPSGAP